MKVLKFIKESLSLIVILVLVLVIRINGILGVNIVVGESMSTTLYPDDIVISSSIKQIERGDIVIVKREDKEVIKRVIGMPGETIESRNGVIYINGQMMSEYYIEEENNVISSTLDWTITTGIKEYVILGDNRDNSKDSRYYGVVQEEDIVRKIYFK